MRLLKTIMNIFSMSMLMAFLLVLLLESVSLFAAVPMVSDNISNPHISTESDLILSYCENSTLRIYPEINGTQTYVDGHIIFVPNSPFQNGRIYWLNYCGKNMSFRAVKPEKLEYTVISGFKDHVAIAFNMEVNRSALESLITFEPEVNYTVEWHHNTLLIHPDSSYGVFELKINGNVSTDRKNRTININENYVAGMGVLSTILYKESIPETPRTYTFIIFPPGIPVLTGFVYGTSFLVYYLLMVGFIAVSLGYMALRYGKPLINEIMEFRRTLDYRKPPKNPFLEIGALLMASLSFTIIFYMISVMFNPNPKIPNFGSMPLWEQIFGLTRASVWEELITRIPFIGLPLLMVHVFAGKKRFSLYKYVLGGWGYVDAATLILITICALMFGFVHMMGGWDATKILPAMVGGMAMGYLYARYGIWASVVLHFANDYLSVPQSIFGYEVLNYGIELFILLGLVAGIYFLYIYSYALYSRFFMEKTPSYARPTPEYYVFGSDNIVYERSTEIIDASGIPYAPYPYRCIRCGNISGEYLGNGLIKCTRCGSISRLPPMYRDSGYPENP